MTEQEEFIKDLRKLHAMGPLEGSGCFKCQNSCNPTVIQGRGWAYECSLNVDNSEIHTLDDMLKCEKVNPQFGFQVGGYYTHMWFTEEADGCLEWVICSDGEFPIDNSEEFIRFHICSFEQIESFVKFWRKELEKRDYL
ncbi:hypothetical protein LCGC14_0466250 [marine sediment metagenome]|uniref:Uncharacterized protein n=1 Tax=marine sediment metagenome TaxID=412755 RepID=A0A0F9SDL0_9ZZZZ